MGGNMRYCKIPGTDLEVSVVCMGTGEIGSSVSKEESFKLLDAMYERGGTFIDTAKDYGNWVPGIERSVSEKTVGEWMETRKMQGKVVVATKGCMPDEETKETDCCSPQTIRRHVEWSLQTLRTDCIDLWYVHRDDPNEPVEGILETLNDLQEKGKIRYFAASNMSLSRIRQAQEAAERKGLNTFCAVQGLWNAALLKKFPYGDPQSAYMNSERFDYHRHKKLPWLCYQSTAFGLFHRFEKGTVEQMNEGFRSFYHEKESYERYGRMKQIAAKYGAPLSEMILSYLYSNPDFTTIPIVGSHKILQVIDNFSCGNLILKPEELTYIEGGKKFGLE